MFKHVLFRDFQDTKSQVQPLLGNCTDSTVTESSTAHENCTDSTATGGSMAHGSWNGPLTDASSKAHSSWNGPLSDASSNAHISWNGPLTDASSKAHNSWNGPMTDASSTAYGRFGPMTSATSTAHDSWNMWNDPTTNTSMRSMFVTKAQLETTLNDYIKKSEIKSLIRKEDKRSRRSEMVRSESQNMEEMSWNRQDKTDDLDLDNSGVQENVTMVGETDPRSDLKKVMTGYSKTIDAIRAGVLHLFSTDTILQCTATPKDRSSGFLDPVTFQLLVSVGAEIFGEPDMGKFRTAVCVKKYQIIRRNLQLIRSKDKTQD